MAKNEIKPLIIEVLKEKEEPITLKKLTKEIRNKRSKTGDTSIKENLLNLLRNRRVRIDVINPEEKNKSTQKSENNKKRSISQKAFFDILTFELVKEERKYYTNILLLLKEFLDNNKNDARIKLECIFEEKIRSIEKDWEKYERKLVLENHPKGVVTLSRVKDLIVKNYLDTNHFPNDQQLLDYIKYFNKLLTKNFPDDPEFLEYLKHFNSIIKHNDKIPKIPLTSRDEELKGYLNLIYNNYTIQDLNYEKKRNRIVNCWVNFIEPLTNDEFLEKILPYPKPTKRSKAEIKGLFSDIIQYLVLSKELPEKKIEEVAWALSDEKDSEKYLNNIINEVTGGRESI